MTLINSKSGNNDGKDKPALIGNAFNDMIVAGAGNDVLDGKGGINVLNGGAGNDTYLFDGTATKTTIVDSKGTDTIELVADGDNEYAGQGSISLASFATIENLDGSAILETDLSLTGNKTSNTITGGEGDDTLYGGADSKGDLLLGGAGDDTYILRDTLDTIIDTEGSNSIKLDASFKKTLDLQNYYTQANINAVDASGVKTPLTIKANDLGDYIIGASGKNTIFGGAGDDTIIGAAGNDYLLGGEGDDVINAKGGINTLNGGSGNDTYLIDGTAKSNSITDAEGTDTVKLVAGYAGNPAYSIASYSTIENLDASDVSTSLVLTGNDLSNVITGGSRNDLIFGGGGNDTLVGGEGLNTLVGGTGDDTYIIDGTESLTTIIELADSGNDTIKFTADADAIYANGGIKLVGNVENMDMSALTSGMNLTGSDENNTIIGGKGNDTIISAKGDDTLVGGGGANTYSFYEGDDIDLISYLGADDVIDIDTSTGITKEDLKFYKDSQGRLCIDYTNGTKGGTNPDIVINARWDDNATIKVGSESIKIADVIGSIPSGGDDTYRIYGNETKTIDEKINGGNDTLKLVAGSHGEFSTSTDLFKYYGNPGYVSLDKLSTIANTIENIDASGITASSVNLMGNALNNTLTGGSLNDYISSGAGNDVVKAGDGDDMIFDESGSDSLFGGAGNDYIYDADKASNDYIDGGEGNDNIQAGGGRDLVYGGKGNDVISGGGSSLFGADGADTIFAGEGDDVIYGNNIDSARGYASYGDGADLIFGEAGNDRIYGSEGNDTISGGTGDDTLDGGVGNDTFSFVQGDGHDFITATDAGDTINIKSSFGLNLCDLKFYIDSSNNFCIDYTQCGVDGDVIKIANWNGRTGIKIQNNCYEIYNNTIDYALGKRDDSYNIYGNEKKTITEEDDGSLDTLKLVADNSGRFVASTSLFPSANTVSIESLSTNANTIENIDASAIKSSNLTLIGNDLDNAIISSAGTDTMLGGAGNDAYYVNDMFDAVKENYGDGIDTVYSSAINYTLSSNVENITLLGDANDNINAAGNELNNVITGNDSSNSINGGLGSDTMLGGLGNDTYFVDNSGDRTVEGADEGYDVVVSKLASYQLSDNIERLTVDSSISNKDFYGVGNDRNNYIDSGSGNDTLNGGVGADSMYGGNGNDTYYVDNAGDLAEERAGVVGAGIDTVISSISYTLGSELENLTLSGVAAINATGNNSNNLIIGNNASNILSAGGGNDTLIGGLGNDSLTGGSGNDLFSFTQGDGHDFITTTDAGDVINISSLAGKTIDKFNFYTDSSNNFYIDYSANGGVDVDVVKIANWNANTSINIYSNGSAIFSDTILSAITRPNSSGDTTYNLYGNEAAKIQESTGNDTLKLVANSSGAFVATTGLFPTSNTVSLDAISATANSIENIDASPVKNSDLVLIGNAGVNTIIGGSGNDTISGGKDLDTSTGYYYYYGGQRSVPGPNSATQFPYCTSDLINYGSANTLIGGAGNDTYLFDGDEDFYINGWGEFVKTIVTEDIGGGVDTIKLVANPDGSYGKSNTSVDVEFVNIDAVSSVANTIENIDASAITTNKYILGLTGNNLNNVIIGSSTVDEIDGGLGNDTIIGGKGDDTFWEFRGADTFIFNEGDGKDIIRDYITPGDDTIVIDTSTGITKNDLLFYSGSSGVVTIDYTKNGIGKDSVCFMGSGSDSGNMTVKIGNEEIHLNDIVAQLAATGAAGLDSAAISALSSNTTIEASQALALASAWHHV